MKSSSKEGSHQAPEMSAHPGVIEVQQKTEVPALGHAQMLHGHLPSLSKITHYFCGFHSKTAVKMQKLHVRGT